MRDQENIGSAVTGVSRRGFMLGTAGLTFAVSVGGWMTARSAEVAAASGRMEATAWVTVGVDNSITIMQPAAEMGQGVMTSLPMIVAEELDADWSKVSVAFAPPNHKVYGNPGFGGFLVTVASRSTTGYWDTLRMAGAQARRVLLDAVAHKWDVPVAELTTGPSVVMHRKSGRKISYGEIARFASPPKELPKLTEADLKKPSEFRIIGQDIPRVDIPAKVNGSASFGMDVQVPGMLYASILRAPAEGNAPAKVDDAGALKVNGVRQVVKLPYGVAVLGDTVEATRTGRDALEVGWSAAKDAVFNSEKAVADYVAKARDVSQKGVAFHAEGDAPAANAAAARRVVREYFADYTYHAQMEPMNATAWVKDDVVEVWAGSQTQSFSALAAAKAAGVKPGQVRFHMQYLGGGFGRRAQVEYVVDAVLLSKAVGKPVKVIWSREDDVQFGKLRPMTAHRIEAGLDADGRLVGWHHRVVGESVLAYTSPDRLKKAKGKDTLTMAGAEVGYGIPNSLAEHIVDGGAARLAAWRAIGAGYTKFAIEAFIDDLAREVGKDAIALRLELLEKLPRARKVIEEVVAMSDYRRKRDGTALGFAYAEVVHSYAAAVAEVSVDRGTGKIRVHNFWNAVDPGIAVQPQNIVAQAESNIVYGLGQCLKERITLDGGVIQQSNFHDYEVMRMADVPEIHTKVISTDNRPTGIGEFALPLTGGAVSNAVMALTGKRLSHMPFTPERVQVALKA
ncbi:MAG: molybdopterin-dependent oxidoreductase [Alphaproteobacteria bacterium]|nr:molybdopterin-dependent oxidoreductase [Alphaproteobacteria bacterium]